MTLHSLKIIHFRCFTPVRRPSYRWHMGRSSLKVLYWAPKDASFLQWSAYRLFKVIQGRKRIWYFVLVRHSDGQYDFRPIFTHSLIISDMLKVFGWKLQIFPILLLCGAPLWMFYSELRGEVYHKETGVMVLFSSEDHMIVVWVILIQHQGVTDRQTYGRIYCSSYGVLLTRCKKHYIPVCDHISSK